MDERVLGVLKRMAARGVRRTTVGAIAKRLRADPVQVLGAYERLRLTPRGRKVIA